jgi:hypothetical protein
MARFIRPLERSHFARGVALAAEYVSSTA